MSGSTDQSGDLEERSFRTMVAEYEALMDAAKQRSGQQLAMWEQRCTAMSDEESALRSAGRWLRGPVDVLGILGVARREVIACRVLAWFLDPAGTHGLGPRPLESLLDLLRTRTGDGADFPTPHLVTITLEEARGDTRADVVVYGSGWSVLIEAKIDAAEGVNQGRRLEERWAGEEPLLVYLTLTGAEMQTGSGERPWIQLTWNDCLMSIEQAIVSGGGLGAAPGASAAHELLRSLRRYWSVR